MSRRDLIDDVLDLAGAVPTPWALRADRLRAWHRTAWHTPEEQAQHDEDMRVELAELAACDEGDREFADLEPDERELELQISEACEDAARVRCDG